MKLKPVNGLLVAILGLLYPLGAALADDTIQALAGEAFRTVSGDEVTLSDANSIATVLVFVNSTCPIANGYAPEINRLYKTYASKAIAFFIVHVETNLTVDSAKKHRQEFGYQCDALIDSEHRLVKLTGATITPEVAVISPQGELLYRGRIDDRFPSIGIQRAKARHTELRDSLDAIIANQPVPVARTQAVGCFIE